MAREKQSFRVLLPREGIFLQNKIIVRVTHPRIQMCECVCECGCVFVHSEKVVSVPTVSARMPVSKPTVDG